MDARQPATDALRRRRREVGALPNHHVRRSALHVRQEEGGDASLLPTGDESEAVGGECEGDWEAAVGGGYGT